jgi:hypothetical protein
MNTDKHGLGNGLTTHAALTGICRSGGSVDTLIRELIRVSRCPPIHVRVADSAVCHQDHLASPIKSALIGVNLRFLSLLCVSASPCRQCGSHLRVRLLSSCFVHPWSSWRLGGSIPMSSLVSVANYPGSASICGASVARTCSFISGTSIPSSISVHPWFSPSDKLANCRSFSERKCY